MKQFASVFAICISLCIKESPSWLQSCCRNSEHPVLHAVPPNSVTCKLLNKLQPAIQPLLSYCAESCSRAAPSGRAMRIWAVSDIHTDYKENKQWYCLVLCTSAVYGGNM